MASENVQANPALGGHRPFPATHWSIVLAAGEEGSPQRQAALESLFRTYSLPIYNYIRRHGYDVGDAQDLTQSFFVHLLTSPLLAKAHPARGRFRGLLMTSLRHFLINEAQRTRVAKRGGDAFFISLDERDAERLRSRVDHPEDGADVQFDRQWALTVMAHALERLRGEWEQRRKADHFEELKVFLSREGSASDYADAGAKLGMTSKAVPVAVHRLRRHYGDLIREEIAQTVSTAAEVEEEVRYLLEVVGGG